MLIDAGRDLTTRWFTASTNTFTTILKPTPLPNDGMPVGKARIARTGRDLTIVSYSAMLHESLGAAEEIAKRGDSK